MKKLCMVLAVVALLATTAQAQMTKNPGDTKGGSDRVVKRELSSFTGLWFHTLRTIKRL